MNSLRGSLASIPGAVSNLLHHQLSSNDDDVSSTASYSDKSLPIPASLVKEQWRLIFTADANAQDLEASIAHCRDLVLHSDECSEERRWLVRHLIDLRYALKELQAAAADPLERGPHVKSVVGHHFSMQRGAPIAAQQYCDHCSGRVWSIVHVVYVCGDCQFVAHQKCVDSVVRVCAHVVATERRYPIDEICPEIGLAAQLYKCAECGTMLHFKNSWIEPRLCDYNGLYYCPTCHWNDSSIIPARIVHDWDFTPRKVSRAALQEIRIFRDKPLMKLEEVNPKLFVFLEKLCAVKKLRQNLIYMRKYLLECREAAEEKLLDKLMTQFSNEHNINDSSRHLIQSNEFYSINDLEQIENGFLNEFLHKIFNGFEQHIRKCSMCMAKAYICEVCSNNEVIFPFDDGCILCDKCNSILHRVCMTRKNMICPKCVRMQERRKQSESNTQNSDDDDD